MPKNRIKIIAPQQREKAEDELAWSQTFVEGVNYIYGFDYVAEPYWDESSIIDTKAVSASGHWPELDIQLTHDKEIDFHPAGAIKEVHFNEAVLEEAITRKTTEALSKYPAEQIKNTILVIQGYMPRQWADDMDTSEFKASHQNNPFKGIYYVVPPLDSKETQIQEETGFVLPIKDCLQKLK